MKCNHSKVNSYEWQECPECGMYVRVNRRHKIVRVVGFVLSLIAAEPVADFAIRVLNLSMHNPRNITHALFGCVFILAMNLITLTIFPIYDVKK